MKELDVLALIIVVGVVLIVVVIMIADYRRTTAYKKYNTKKQGGFPEPPEPPPAPPKPERITPENMIWNGVAHKAVTKVEYIGSREWGSESYIIDEDHETTKEFRRLEKLKNLAMFGVIDGIVEYEPEYITVTVDEKYLGKWGK